MRYQDILDAISGAAAMMIVRIATIITVLMARLFATQRDKLAKCVSGFFQDAFNGLRRRSL